jgi:hypothetical protein
VMSTRQTRRGAQHCTSQVGHSASVRRCCAQEQPEHSSSSCKPCTCLIALPQHSRDWPPCTAAQSAAVLRWRQAGCGCLFGPARYTVGHCRLC